MTDKELEQLRELCAKAREDRRLPHSVHDAAQHIQRFLSEKRVEVRGE